MRTKSLFNRWLIIILSIALVLSSFPSLQGSAYAEAAQNSPAVSKVAAVPTPSATPSPEFSKRPEPQPTAPPVDFKERSDLSYKQTVSESSVMKDVYLTEDGNPTPPKPFNILEEEPELRLLALHYSEQFGSIQEPYLSKELVEELAADGARIKDMYAIAFLQDLLDMPPLKLWEEQQLKSMSWIELEASLTTKMSGPSSSKTVTDDVYPIESGTFSLHREQASIIDAVYSESELAFPQRALYKLNQNIASLLNGNGMKVINQTFKEQYSDHYETNEAIDPATGTLTWKSNQISLPGRDGLDLNLGVIYSSNQASPYLPNATNEYGTPVNTREIYDYNLRRNQLGLGWSFRIPYVDTDNSQIYYHDGEGGNYELRQTNESGAGGYSLLNLKDYQKGDTKVYYSSQNQELYVERSDHSREYYTMRDTWPSNYGELYQKVDRFGNKITYEYGMLEGTNGERALKKITDTIGRTLEFDYVYSTPANPVLESLTVTVKDPGQRAVQRIKYTQDNLFMSSTGEMLSALSKIDIEGKVVTEFNYQGAMYNFDYYHRSIPSMYSTYTANLILTKVKYNSTSETVYVPEKAVHNLGNEGLIEQSRIMSRYDVILKQNGVQEINNRINYEYNGDYSGFPALLVEKGNEMVLPDGYTFSSAAIQLDKSGQQVEKVTTAYNHERQMVSVDETILAGANAGERKVERYTGFQPNFKYTPTSIEQLEYQGDADPNPNQLFTDISYDALGYVTSQTVPLNVVQRNDLALKEKYTTRYTYDSTFHFIASQSRYQNESDSVPKSQTYSYTAQGRLQNTMNPLGEATEYVYENAGDGSGSLHKMTAILKTAGGKIARKTATTFGAETGYAYPTKQEDYIDIGQPAQQIISKTMGYDLGLGKLVRETDGNNQTTSYAYDELGRLLKITRPSYTNTNGVSYSETEEYKYTNNQVSTNYDAVNAGTKSFVVDTIHTVTQTSNGNTVKTYGIVFYNGLGQALLEERYDPNVERYTQTQYHYDEWSRPVYSIDPAGNTLTASYDGWGRQNRATNANNDQMVSDYNFKTRTSASYIKDHTNGEVLNYVEQSYDPWGNKLSAATYKDWPTNQQRIAESYRYDIMGNVTGYTDPNHNLNEDGVTTSFTYDALGRLISLKDALNQTTNYSYDGNGQVTKVTIQAKGGTPQTLNTKAYNELGLPSVKQDGASQSESYTYNNLGQLAAKTDRNGSSFGYVYDESGQLKTSTIRGNINSVAQIQETKMIYGDGSPDKQTVRTLTNGVETASHTQTQNSLGQVSSVYSKSGAHAASIGNQLDVLGRMKQITDNYMGFSANYQYSKERLDKVQTNGSSTLNSDPSVNAQYSYYANNQIHRIVYPTLTDGSQLITTYTYNKALGWTEMMQNTKGSGSLSSYNYSYDNNGNRISVSEARNGAAAQKTNYSYDALNRLISISRPDGGQTTYTYDVRGNRLTLSDTSSASTDSADTSYTYDLQNTLTSVTKGGASTSFKYYADGMRSMKTKGNTQTQVNYNFQGQVISEEKIVNGTFVEQANFVRGDRVLVKKDKKAAKDYYYLYNGHGDVVQIVDTNGTVVNNYTYDEWGNITSQDEKTSNSFKYTGEVYDEETGLYYLRARYYDPSMGRFLNEDTVEGQITNPLSQNLYTYVGNNPLIFSDPSGHSMESDHVLPQHVLNQLAPLSAGWEDLQRQLLSLDNSSTSNITRMNIIALQTTIHRAAQNIRFNYFSTIKNPTQTQIDAASSAGYIFGKNVDLSAGYKGRVDAQNDGSGTQRHGHIFGPKGEEWARNLDGTIHDANRNSPGSPPKWVQKEMEKKTRFKWNEVNSTLPTSSINPGNAETGLYVVGGGYLAYRGIRLLPSLIPILWPTLPANLLAP
ncbi:RHS repeat-associated core domain-containing protein [Paenibacillus sp. FSL H8-0122]|uniref:RHS repeat-associated core domain-containing protein n=1 Tax=Paenibacillus sp. FSL H8-0122 TaxID=2954510 RepID=UPI0030F60D7B